MIEEITETITINHSEEYCKEKILLRERVCFLIADKKENQASEEIVTFIEKYQDINSIKQDKTSEVWYYEEGIRKPNGEAHIKEICRDILGDLYTSQRANKVMDKIETDTYIEADEFFKLEQENVDEIACLNGILNLKTRELTPFTPDKFFFNKINAEYKQDVKCPNIESFLKDVLKSPVDICIAEETIGYALYKRYILQVSFMFYGDGENGKGVFGSLVKTFLGARHCSGVPLTQLTPDSYSCSELFGKLVNLAGDIGNTDLKDSSRFKELCSGTDLIGAKRKYLNDLFFVNYAKLIFSCNELPKVYDLTHGFWRRWIILEFPHTFKKKKEYDLITDKKGIKLANPTIINDMTTKEELSGLLNSALDGLDRILLNKQFSSTQSTEEVKNFWIRKSDSFTAFCMDELEESCDSHITKKDLRRKFSSYCKKHKIKSSSDKSIKITLENMFGVVEGRKIIAFDQEYVWEGIKWKD